MAIIFPSAPPSAPSMHPGPCKDTQWRPRRHGRSGTLLPDGFGTSMTKPWASAGIDVPFNNE